MSESRLIVPEIDEQPWPSLGGDVGAWIEASLCHGPGDVLGDQVTLTEEEWLFLYRTYEVFPHEHPLAGRRRFKRAVYSRRKGARKTELAAWIAIAELDPSAPVRCGSWREVGGAMVPVGRGVRDPYIPMVATTEEQTDDLAYGAVKAILEHCPLGNEYDIGIERITHRSEPGELKALAGAPNAREGARTTFQHFDEPHLYVSGRLKSAHSTMLRNVPKRKIADAWSLETTTMYEPGQDSVAEQSHLYAIDIAAGRVEDPRIYFDHRQASGAWDLRKRPELVKAIKEASGDALSWTDVDGIVAQFLDPTSDKAKNRRHWLNQRVKGSRRWLPPEVIDALAEAGAERERPEYGARVVLTLDGSYSRDSTALVGCTVEEEKPHIWVEAVWEKPLAAPAGTWRVNRTDVLEAVRQALEFYEVVEFAPDPPGWHREIEELEDEYGDVVVRFETNQPSRMGPAAESFEQGARDGAFTIEGSEELRRHLANCVPTNRRGYTVPVKESDDSPNKIDAAVGSVIAYARARWHALNTVTEAVPWRAF